MKFRSIEDLVRIPKELAKAYSEGVYADTPQNRRLGRVGMSYKEWTSKQQKQQKFELSFQKIPFKIDKESGKPTCKISDGINLVYHPRSRARGGREIEPYYELEYGNRYRDGKAFDISKKEAEFIYSKFKKNPKELENIIKESKWRHSLSENLKKIMSEKDSEGNFQNKENKQSVQNKEDKNKKKFKSIEDLPWEKGRTGDYFELNNHRFDHNFNGYLVDGEFFEEEEVLNLANKYFNEEKDKKKEKSQEKDKKNEKISWKKENFRGGFEKTAIINGHEAKWVRFRGMDAFFIDDVEDESIKSEKELIEKIKEDTPTSREPERKKEDTPANKKSEHVYTSYEEWLARKQK